MVESKVFPSTNCRSSLEKKITETRNQWKKYHLLPQNDDVSKELMQQGVAKLKVLIQDFEMAKHKMGVEERLECLFQIEKQTLVCVQYGAVVDTENLEGTAENYIGDVVKSNVNGMLRMVHEITRPSALIALSNKEILKETLKGFGLMLVFGMLIISVPFVLFIFLLSLLPWEQKGGGNESVVVANQSTLAWTLIPGLMFFYALLFWASARVLDTMLGSKAFRPLSYAFCACSFVYALVLLLIGPEAFLANYLDFVVGAIGLAFISFVQVYTLEATKQRSEDFKAKWAAKVQRAKQLGKKEPVLRSIGSTALKNCVPVFIVLVFAYLYVFTIHPLFKACVYDYQRTLVYILSLCIVKSGGEKLLKYVIEEIILVPERFADMILFTYEMVLSLEARLLLLSMPSTEAVFFTAILTALWEFSLRMFFVSRHRKKGETLEGMAKDTSVSYKFFTKKYKRYVRKAVVLTSNTCGDMVVEYAGANAAMAIYVCFSGKIAAFRFASFSGDNNKLTLIMALSSLAAQHVPEMICDTLSIWFEVRAGLRVTEYFSLQAKSFDVIVAKLSLVFCSAFIVLVTMRTYF